MSADAAAFSTFLPIIGGGLIGKAGSPLQSARVALSQEGHLESLPSQHVAGTPAWGTVPGALPAGRGSVGLRAGPSWQGPVPCPCLLLLP